MKRAHWRESLEDSSEMFDIPVGVSHVSQTFGPDRFEGFARPPNLHQLSEAKMAENVRDEHLAGNIE